jgi:hypothetical protein
VVHDQISRPVFGLMWPTQNRESALSGRPRRKACDNSLPATTSDALVAGRRLDFAKVGLVGAFAVRAIADDGAEARLRDRTHI